MASAANPRRSWLQPRFSLRVLLLAVTAFAIGFPIWWRWPHEETLVIAALYEKPILTRVFTWQRQWGGERLANGPERMIAYGQLLSLINYRNGKKHGPCEIHGLKKPAVENALGYEVDPDVVEIGQYVDDEKHGTWTEVKNGQKTVTTWDHGKQVTP